VERCASLSVMWIRYVLRSTYFTDLYETQGAEFSPDYWGDHPVEIHLVTHLR